MNSKLLFSIIFIFLVFTNISYAQERIVKELSNNWKFHKGKSELAFQKNFDDSLWETVTVPHDWAIYGPFDKEIDKQTVAIVQNNDGELYE